MSGSKRERSLLNSQDRDFHNLPTYENNGQFPYADNYWYGQQPYWDPFMEQMLYNQYAAMGYYQPQYPPFYIPPTTPVSKTFANKPTTALTPAPLGRIIPQETISSALPVVPVAVPVPPRRTVAIPVPVRHYEPPPPPHYYPRSPPSPYYHSRRPPPPHHYYDSDRLPQYVAFYIRSDNKF
jgi:hypothetical protein